MLLSFRWLNRHVFATSAAEFSRSATARDSEFSTSKTERGTFWLNERHCGDGAAEWDASPEPQRGVHSPPSPSRKRQRRVRGRVIIQFAANDPVQLADAAELVQPWVDGIDLNCGASTSRHDFIDPSARAHNSSQAVRKSGLTRRASDVLCCGSRSSFTTWSGQPSHGSAGTSPSASRSV